MTIPVDIPNYSSPGMSGNGMDKGDFRSSPAPEISAKIHRFSSSPAAAVTTYAAAEAEASAGLGAARLLRKETTVAPIQTVF